MSMPVIRSYRLIILLADVSTKEWISSNGQRVAAIFDEINGLRKGSHQGMHRKSSEEKAAEAYCRQILDRGGWRFSLSTPFRYGDDVFSTAVAPHSLHAYSLLKTSPLYLAVQRRRAARRHAGRQPPPARHPVHRPGPPGVVKRPSHFPQQIDYV
jgi:hypothetical protein